MSFRPHSLTGHFPTPCSAPWNTLPQLPTLPVGSADPVTGAGRLATRRMGWFAAAWICLFAAGSDAAEQLQDTAVSGVHGPTREWTNSVPSLLPSSGAQPEFPNWEHIPVGVLPVSTVTAADGWRPAGFNSPGTSGKSTAAGFASAPRELPANETSRSGWQPTDSDSTSTSDRHSSRAPNRGTELGSGSVDSETWVQTVLAEGQQLASGDRWSEALAIYQIALRKAPHSRTLLQQRQQARIHVDLRHRLTDPKYVAYARTDSAEMAFAHLNEILYKIELNHLEQPNWREIFQHGWRSLTVALSYPDFQSKFLGRSLDDAAAALTARLHAQLESAPVRNQTEMTGLVREVAYEMERQLGLKTSVVLHEFAGTAASALDTYSTFLSPGQFDDLNSQIRGNFVGIGVELRPQADHLEIIKAIPGGPADRARIRGGDKMLAVDDRLVSDIGGDQAADLLRGNEGSVVTVVVETPEGKQYRLKMQRARVDIPSIDETRMVDTRYGVGYIKLANFQKNTPSDFDRSLRQLQQQGIRHLILDLRDNPGGALDAAVAVADRFVSQGTIVSTKGRSLAENMTYSASALSFAAQLPLTILINEHSASASEILAGAIADHKRGTIIGQKSFGKGVVQTILPLTSGRGGIRLTTAEYFSPTGQRVELQGVTPDLIVQTTARPELSDEGSPNAAGSSTVAGDEVLAAAIRRITGAGLAP